MQYTRKLTAFLTALLLCTGALPASAAAEEPALLDISQFTVMDENLVHLGADYLRDASVLFDDQDKVPASPENTSVDPELWEATDHTNWKPNMQAFGDDSFYIDFGANYVITGICFMDSNGVNEWKVEAGEPFAWEEIGAFTTDWYNAWRGLTFEAPKPTRYLRFSTPAGDSGVAELAVYGYFASELTAEQKAKTAPKPNTSEQISLTAGGIIGFNAFIDDPMTAIMAGGNVREYHNFNWLLDASGKTKFTQGTWGDMDSFYASMKDQNIDIIPCFQAGSSVISGDADSVPEIPVPAGADTLDPASYAVHAQTLYQVAARYGSNKDIDLSTIIITDAQEVKVGMGLLKALENSNEPNKGWAGKANYFTPYELAAMCSADYDGHEGTIPNAGVKTADPEFKLAMGGLVGTATMIDYLDEMKLWFDYNRTDGKFAVDIINVHIGPDTANPEDSSFVDRIHALQAWIDENAPGTELWISEFEVVMSDCEIEGTDNHDNENFQLKYAQRVARTYLAAIAEGVDRVSKFQLRDEGEGVYYDSGLVTQKGSWEKKKAWYYVSCMTEVLENADFTKDLSKDGVSCYQFTDRGTGESIYCLWSPTNEDKVIAEHSLSIGDAAYAYLTVPSEYAEGTTSELAVRDGAVTLDVSETPVFVRTAAVPEEIINGKGQYIAPESICLTADFSTEINDLTAAPEDATLNQFFRMFDEPQTMPSMIYGSTAGLEKPSTNVNAGNITCYAKFDKPYSFTGFGVYDTYGTGGISVYDAYTDELLWSSDLGGYMYRAMTLTAESAPTDCLKIVKAGGEMNELALYGYAAPAAFEMDVNGDGRVDAFDLTPAKKQSAKAEFSGKVTDIIRIQRFLLGG